MFGKPGENPRRKAIGPVKWQPVALFSIDCTTTGAGDAFLLGAFVRRQTTGIEIVTKRKRGFV